MLAYDAVSTFEPTVPLPSADPVGTPLAAFLETDLVIVFDHLAHTLSAIAALHTDAPDFDAALRRRRARGPARRWNRPPATNRPD